MELTPCKTVHGFTVRTTSDLPEIDGRAYVLDHNASRAQLLYLQNDDANKAFSIAFKTPPANDTGVFHILEHSVLCGSDKFPVKEPFVNLLKSSMQTFLNAMTYPDKTIYPVASTNEQDLLNLMDVYLDAVLHPAIFHKRTIFEQEGWHVELAGKEGSGELAYNGVVYNEMKGALSDPESILYDELSAALFPDTAYRFESGGKPSAIPTLSYEEFLDTHRRHYNLANAKIVLYGNMDIERFLAFLDERYLAPDAAEAGADGAPNPLELQAPVMSFGNKTPMKTAPENACCAVGFVAGTAADRERMIAMDILLDAIFGSNEAPAKRALLDENLACDIVAYMADAMLQPFAVVQAKGLEEGAAERLRPALSRVLTELADGALDHDVVAAALSHAEFVMREQNFGIADGVALACSCMAGWLYDDGAALDYLRYEDAFESLRKKLDEGYFEQLIREVFLENDHAADAEVVPVGKAPDDDDAAATRLAQMERELDDKRIAAIEADVAALRRAQEEPDSPEALATLPRMRASDIEQAPAEPAFRLDESGEIPVIRHDVATRGIVYAYRYYGLERLTFEELPYAKLLAMVLGKLATSKHTATEIDTLTQAKLGNLAFYTEVHEREDDRSALSPKLTVSCSALAENAEWAATLPSEIIEETLYDDFGKIRDILVQKRVSMEQNFANAGHTAAMAHVASYYLPAAVVREQIDGVGFYRFLKRTLATFDDEKEALAAKLAEVARRIFTDDNCTIGFTGKDDDFNRVMSAGLATGRTGEPGCTARLVVPEPQVPATGEAFAVPTDVTYTALGFDRRLLGVPYSGAWLVASRALSYDFLWNEVRVKGGAYGAGFSPTRTGNLRFYSYRDPHVNETLERFRAAGAWLSDFSPSEPEMDGYIVSTVAGLDAPLKPRELARRQDGYVFAHIDPAERLVTRSQVANATIEEVRALGDAVSQAASKNIACVFGNREIIESAKADFTVVDLLGE